MTTLRRLLTTLSKKDEYLTSIEHIASKMTPVDESQLHLPRSFAHTVRRILEHEENLAANKAMDADEK